MTLNPITALSEQLQKLINEHGSAAILRDHLALFKDQVVLLEKENTPLRQKMVELESANTVLKAKNEQLEKDNQELRSKIREYERPHSSLLSDVKVKILLFLASRSEEFTGDEIAGAIGENVQIVLFHLKELTDQRMINDALAMGAPRRWYIGHEGRKYLIEQKLIS